MKVRILKRTNTDLTTHYVIQQTWFIYSPYIKLREKLSSDYLPAEFMWVRTILNGNMSHDVFVWLSDAKKNLHNFDDSKIIYTKID